VILATFGTCGEVRVGIDVAPISPAIGISVTVPPGFFVGDVLGAAEERRTGAIDGRFVGINVGDRNTGETVGAVASALLGIRLGASMASGGPNSVTEDLPKSPTTRSTRLPST
jgi:hypothetical protein